MDNTFFAIAREKNRKIQGPRLFCEFCGYKQVLSPCFYCQLFEVSILFCRFYGIPISDNTTVGLVLDTCYEYFEVEEEAIRFLNSREEKVQNFKN